MRPSHPWQALCFIYGVDLAAVLLLVSVSRQFGAYSAVEWISAVLFAALMVAARLMLTNTDIQYGWYMAVEFAVIVALPVPLACLVHLPTVPAGMFDRWTHKHPEPFLGPDYNAAASIICVFGAGYILEGLRAVMAPEWTTLLLLPVAIVFMAIQYVLLNTLVCLDKQVPWHRTGLFHHDSVIGDMMMTLLGALIGRLYGLDRSTILLTVVPLALLQRTLQRIQKAKLADYDPKTGLHNYRYLDNALTEEVRKATQNGRPLTVIFGDMDYLRDINNTYGHLAGDRALHAVARVFRKHARPGDVAARFGGEEFVLLLPGTEKFQAWEIAERVRRDVAAARLETDDGGVFSITISLGLATFPQDAHTVQGLIKAADEAVYSAKHGGRNRVCTYGSGVAI